MNTTSDRSPIPFLERSGFRWLGRVFRLWRLYAWLDLMWATRSFKDFVAYSFSDLVANAAGLAAVLLLAEWFAGIGGWSRLQVIFLVGYATLVAGLLDLLFGYNVLFISRRLGRGQLDHTLVQPQPLWLTLGTEGFVPVQASGTVLLGLGVLTWTLEAMRFPLTTGWLGLLILNVAGSGAVLWAFAYGWGSLAFWQPRAAEEINSSTNRLLRELRAFPLDGLRPALRSGLITFIPAGYLAWYPSRALLGIDPNRWSVLGTPLAGLGLALIAAAIFRRGLGHYHRVGSQRYLTAGHRR